MKAYRIRDWDRHYENNRSRELRRPEWLPLPNKFDGRGFMELMDEQGAGMPQDGAGIPQVGATMAHYGAWCLLLAAASRMPTRGFFVADSGRPYSLKDLARMTRGSLAVFEAAVPRLVAIGWVEEVDLKTAVKSERDDDLRDHVADDERADGAGMSHRGAGIPQEGAGLVRLNKKGKGNEKENRNRDPHAAAAVASTGQHEDTADGGGGDKAVLAKRLKAIEPERVRAAVEEADAQALAIAFHASGENPGEWAREADGMQAGLVAVIFAWRYEIADPIRLPSGLRRARVAWRALPADQRTAMAVRLAASLGFRAGEA